MLSRSLHRHGVRRRKIVRQQTLVDLRRLPDCLFTCNSVSLQDDGVDDLDCFLVRQPLANLVR